MFYSVLHQDNTTNIRYLKRSLCKKRKNITQIQK